MSCLGPYYIPVPPREWSRVQSSCSYFPGTYNPYQYVISPLTGKEIPLYQLDFDIKMATKGNVLQYKKNSSNLAQWQRYSKIAQGKWTNRNTTWATQSQSYTNPNTKSLKRVNGTNVTIDGIPTTESVTCPSNIVTINEIIPIYQPTPSVTPVIPPPPPPSPGGSNIPIVPIPEPAPPVVIQDFGNLLCNVTENICTGQTQIIPSSQNCHPTTDSNVPGPIQLLCWSNRIQTWYPKQRTTMPTSTNKWPVNSKAIFPVNGFAKPVPPILSLASVNSCNSITLNWTNSIFYLPISNYCIYQNGFKISVVSNTTNNITINNIQDGQNYFYVTAVSNSIESNNSNIIDFTASLTYVATGNYTVYNNNGYTGIVFEYPSGSIQFNCNVSVNLLLVGGGGGGGGNSNCTIPEQSGGGGGGIYLNNNFNIDTNLYNISIGKGGSGTIFNTLSKQTPGGNTTISNGLNTYFANGGGISYGPLITESYGGIGGNSSDGFSTGGNGGNWYPFTSNGQDSTYISTILPFTTSPTTLYLSGGGGAGVYGLIPTDNYSGYAGKGYGGLTGAYPYPLNNYNGQSAVQSIIDGGYGGGGGSAAAYYANGNGGNGGNGVCIIWWQNQ